MDVILNPIACTPMLIKIFIVGGLFPAVPLMMVNFGNRYKLLAGLIRNLHHTVINTQALADDSARVLEQIANLALDVHLPNLEKHQEWRDYIERKKSRRKSASNTPSEQPPS